MPTEPKCEACGTIGAEKYIYVRTLNGGLNLCAVCLANINGKNPELMAARKEIERLKRGDFTPEEFQNLCHHRDEKPGCTPFDFRKGCEAYQRQLFGELKDGPPLALPPEFGTLHGSPLDE